jgi:hypothetical protein
VAALDILSAIWPVALGLAVSVKLAWQDKWSWSKLFRRYWWIIGLGILGSAITGTQIYETDTEHHMEVGSLNSSINALNSQLGSVTKHLSSMDSDFTAFKAMLSQYLRNITPVQGITVAKAPQKQWRPAAPTGFVVVLNNDYASPAKDMAAKIAHLLDSRGHAPVRHTGESDIDFLVRSNDWYSSIMKDYKKQYGDQVETMVRMLVNQGALDSRVEALAKNPVNVAGLRLLAMQLKEGGQKATPPR